MTSKFLRLFLAAAVLLTISALAQTSSAATPSSPSGAAATPAAPVAVTGATKIGTININEAIFGSNEGRRDLETLSKKFEPKQNELKGQSDELEGLKKQMNDQQSKLNDEALATLRKQIETKQKLFDRSMQDAQEDFRSQQQEIMGRVLNKMAPMIVKYAQDNGFGMVLDTSTQWPQSPLLWAGENVDITKAIIDGYNVVSGVPAPATTGTAKPTGPRAPGAGAGSSGATKPAPPKPSTTTPQQ